MLSLMMAHPAWLRCLLDNSMTELVRLLKQRAKSLRIEVSVNEALYLALALHENATLFTDDRRLLQAARRDVAIRPKVRWIAGI